MDKEVTGAIRVDGPAARQLKTIDDTPILKQIFNALPEICIVVNEKRQVVFGNEALLQAVGENSSQVLIGLRNGEALNCVNAGKPHSCGGSDACRFCGATSTITESQLKKQRVTRECRLNVRRDNVVEACDFRVTASPLNIGEEQLTVVTLKDISDEKRRKALERIFFHDVLNSAGALQGFLHEVIAEDQQEDIKTLAPELERTAAQLLEDITAQRDLLAAENNDLVVVTNSVDSLELLEDVQTSLSHHPVAEGKKFLLAPDSKAISFVTDPKLVRRVVANAAKNALEASSDGGVVTLCSKEGGLGVLFSVNNKAVMSDEVRHQVFQRSFSTKGEGRGIGTYSIKLLTERYLHGRVSFTSSPAQGTTFTVTYPITWNGRS